jgi:hypothetical protein
MTVKGAKDPGSIFTSVADPDPSDPYVFGPPGSGSISKRHGSFYHQATNLDSYRTVLLLLFDFLSLKNDVNVPSTSNKQKSLFNKISFLLAS